MDIAVDTNILFSDPWMRTYAVKVLLDYVQKTYSKMLLSSIVVAELKGQFERQWEEARSGIEVAASKASSLTKDKIEISYALEQLESSRHAWYQFIDGLNHPWWIEVIDISTDSAK